MEMQEGAERIGGKISILLVPGVGRGVTSFVESLHCVIRITGAEPIIIDFFSTRRLLERF